MTMKARFGKKLAVPSTIGIKHELRMMELSDRIAALSTQGERASIIGELTSEYGIPTHRAKALVDRYGIEGQLA